MEKVNKKKRIPLREQLEVSKINLKNSEDYIKTLKKELEKSNSINKALNKKIENAKEYEKGSYKLKKIFRNEDYKYKERL